MAEAQAAAPAESAAPAGGKQKRLVAILVIAGALLGGLAASLVVAPRIIARRDAQAAPDSAAATGGEAGGGEGEHGAPGGEAKMVELENIIVNPAGSQGTRLLMATVVVSVPSDLIQKQLTERNVELRDRVTTILESRTMPQLTAPGARDSLKTAIGAVVASILGPKVQARIYVPQYVIQ